MPVSEGHAVKLLDEKSVELVLATLSPDGQFPLEHLRTLRHLGSQRKAVVLAFPPKAAGTFFRSAIIKAVDGQLVRAVHALGGRDATPYLPVFLHYYNGGVTDKTLVAHLHMLGLPANLHLLAAFGIKPVVVERCIPDMLASYWDMLEQDAEAMLHGLNCRIPTNFRNMSSNAKADFVIDMLGPWYVNYYATWLTQFESDPNSVVLIDFRDLKNNPADTLARCLQAVGLPQSRADCEAAIIYAWDRRHDLRFNKGEEGRGEKYFRQAHINRLSRMLGHYQVLTRHRSRLLGIAGPGEKRKF